MKPATLFLISLLIFVFTSPSLSRSILGEGDHLVFDAFGDPLEEGARYIIGPAVWGVTGGAGILSVSYENGACAAYVKKDSEQVSTGTPFTFRNIYPSKEKTIKLGYPVAILSPDENPCDDTTVWKVTDQVTSLNLTRGTKVISTGGNINAEYSCFKFTKPEPRLWPNSYFIEHAPHLCNGANVARKVGGYMGYYATNDSPEQYVFVKRDPAEFAAKLS